MRYLKNFSLYEAKTQKSNPVKDQIMDAMVNTPAGKDLAAMARSYSVNSTGTLTLEGLRGKTYVAQDPNRGVWNHWVVAKGRTYAEGESPTLEACLRDCWREFVLNSTTFRPKGMKIKEYTDQIGPVLSSLEGKALDIYDLQWEILKILKGTPDLDTIREARFLLDFPELQGVFDFIGLELEKGIEFRGDAGFELLSYQIADNDSPLAQILPYADMKNPQNAIKLKIKAIPEDEYRVDPDMYWSIFFQVGGDVSKKQEYKERFIRDLISALRSQTSGQSMEPSPQAMLAAAAIESALNGDAANLAAMVADLVHDVSKLVQLPEPLRSEVMSKKGYEPDEIEAASTSKQYGLI
jgi:hypothetical protein